MKPTLLGLLAAAIALTLTPAVASSTAIAQNWGIVESGEPTDAEESMVEPSQSPNGEPTSKEESEDDLVQQVTDTDTAASDHYNRYRRVIADTASMVNDSAAQRLAQRFGLDILNVTWEDTGRYKNSAVGPNISDMTIQIQQQDPSSGQYNLSLMPVIRHPNFSDKTADVDLDKFFVLVGNEKGEDLQRVSVRELLGNLRDYMHEPDSWKGRKQSLLAPRDSHALVSAQAAFLPIPQAGDAVFNPVLFNYQSTAEDPAVLTILATREGTSMTVIDNTRDGFEAGQTWGQRLFFNKNGDRASFTGQRLSDYNQYGDGRGNGGAATPDVSEEDGLNMVLLIQVPLKQKEQPRSFGIEESMIMSDMVMPSAASEMKRSDVEAAVIGHGEVEGPFTEIDDLAIERDPRFPIRATVQFYKATSNGAVSEADMQQINDQIAKVYEQGDYVGSLVTGGETERPTEYDGPKQEPPGWWEDFWQRHEENTGKTRWDVFALWRQLRGDQ